MLDAGERNVAPARENVGAEDRLVQRLCRGLEVDLARKPLLGQGPYGHSNSLGREFECVWLAVKRTRAGVEPPEPVAGRPKRLGRRRPDKATRADIVCPRPDVAGNRETRAGGGAEVR